MNKLLRFPLSFRLKCYQMHCVSNSSSVVHSSTSSRSPPNKRVRTEMPVEQTTGCTKMPVLINKPTLQITKLSPDATLPTRGSEQSAGLDLYCSKDAWVPALGKCLVNTDISIALPDGCYGRVAPRSGLSVKHFVDVGAGVIDQDYRGEVKVLLFNFNRIDFEVKKGDRIAQLICEKIFIPEVELVTELSKTDRGAGGFGSTGRT